MNSPLLLPQWIAFVKHKRIGQGLPTEVASRVKAYAEDHPDASVLVLDAHSSHTVEIDLRGSLAAVLKRLPTPEPETSNATDAGTNTSTDAARGPGRPKLGVVAREVTLLPRHWDWLGAQSGGASVALRKLVEQAQRSSAEADRKRAAQESTYRFMHAVAGDVPGFEEASRALFAGNLERLQTETEAWPRDVRKHLLALAAHMTSNEQKGSA